MLQPLHFFALAPLLVPVGPSQGTTAVTPPQVPPQPTLDADDSGRVHRGERLDPSTYGAGVVESMDVVLQRERERPMGPEKNSKARNGARGAWSVPGRNASEFAHSGVHYVTNRWGDTRMGLAFGETVDVLGAWFAGQGGSGSWTSGVQIVGYRGDVEVARTSWFEDVDASPSWFAADVRGVDRIEVVARAVTGGAGWYALDDFAFVRRAAPSTPVVLDFEDTNYGDTLTDSSYRGLRWESGTGEFQDAQDATEAVHPPLVPPGMPTEPLGAEVIDPTLGLGASATPPSLGTNFVGPRLGDAGAGLIPPDTCGAVGINHFVAVVNANISIYVKSTGARVLNSSLTSFFGQSAGGDPRCVFDPHSQRFIVLSTDFNTKILIAVSTTSDPTGSWFKTTFNPQGGVDAGAWPDYPTLGVDANGIYTSSYMVGGNFDMALFVIDKAPLVAPVQSLGTITAFRDLPWEGAIQPCVTYGSPTGEYLVSRRNATRMRLRLVTGPMTSPTLTEVGQVPIPTHSGPPDAPALGSTTPLDALDTRPMNAVFRNGSVWTAHGITSGGRSSIRWYELNPTTITAVQTGTIADPILSFMDGSIAVNAAGDVALGFSGSDASQFAACYFTGRNAGDPPGVTATPVLLKAGQGAYNHTDGNGTNRWGDYSLTSVDPTDDNTFWTIQEYARTSNQWGTWIGKLNPGCPGTPDCNSNGIVDSCDLEAGTSLDSNANGIPDECEGLLATPFCFGDGSLATACPCAPPDFVPFPSGASDGGCGNSFDIGGARMTVSGSTSPDTITISVNVGLKYVGFGFLVKGDAQNAAGVANGDGVRCVDGALLRFGGHNASTNGAGDGQWTYPNTAQTTAITAMTLQPPAASAYYQLFYRNAAAGWCGPGTTNWSNGFEIFWP
ncbi:MAG: hypothetical protein ACKVWV_08135 [Planctomycetota bacterium]